MIIKSMSRKVPSFGQLLEYIDRDEGQEAFTLRHNLLGRDGEAICAEFENNAELMQKRKNGTYLFHEIISITRAKGLSPSDQKDRLLEIAHEYISARCPDSLVYGGLHQDKDHSYHMHLMISSNRAGEKKRQRLTKHQFREIQVKLEEHVLQTYPELEQKLAIGKESDRSLTKKEAELERRTGKRPIREEILERVQAAYAGSTDRDSLLAALGREGLELYVRGKAGKTIGVTDLETGKNHRLKTLDLEVADLVEIRLSGLEPEAQVEAENAAEGEKEKERERTSEENEAETDNGDYVKYDSSADLNPDRASQQENDKPNKANRVKEDEMESRKHSSDPEKPSPERQEMIDKGHVKPDPERDLMSHEDWRDQDTFLEKVKQSMKRTFDDVTGRTKDLEDKAQGKENASSRSAQDKPQQESDRSTQQEKWRSEIKRSRDAGRDDPEQGRE